MCGMSSVWSVRVVCDVCFVGYVLCALDVSCVLCVPVSIMCDMCVSVCVMCILRVMFVVCYV